MRQATRHPLYALSGSLAAGLVLLASGCHPASLGGASRPEGAKPSIAARPARPPSPPPLPLGGVRGIYLTGWTAGSARPLARLVRLADRTEINAMVIDVKDNGQISYDVAVPLARQIHASRRMIAHIDALLAVLKAHDIFPIARIACFRDTPLAEAHPEMAVHAPNGKVWHDRSHHAWLNPFYKAAWDYNVDIALDAIKHGFKEVQFDYVRFPSEGNISALRYPGKPKGSKRQDQIAAFLKYARQKIKAQGAWFSADVFGLTSLTKSDMGIGQTRTNVAREVDYLCPMVYPSHYGPHEYGIANPNTEPYRIIYHSLGDAKQRLKGIPTCRLRPWLQDFDLRGVHYGPAQVKAEIKAARDLGIREFLLWNARCRYTEAALAKDTPPRMAKK